MPVSATAVKRFLGSALPTLHYHSSITPMSYGDNAQILTEKPYFWKSVASRSWENDLYRGFQTRNTMNGEMTVVQFCEAFRDR